MSFKPLVSLTQVPRNNASFTLTDATPTDNVSGWGSPNAPASPSAIISLFGQVQQYGDIPVNATGVVGLPTDPMIFTASVQDGVNNFIALYGLQDSLSDFTISNDGLTLTSTDGNFSNFFDGVGAISLDGTTFPVLILGQSSNSLTLASPLPANTTGTALYKYWIATTQALVLNNGEGHIINQISQLPLDVTKCVDGNTILLNILLKLAAEISINCGNISKAHEAALLLGGNKPPTANSNCASCG